MNALAELLSSRVRAEICRLLFAANAGPLHLRELARRSRHSFSAVQRETGKLARLGVVVKREDGNRTYICANNAHPFYPEIRSMVRKAFRSPRRFSDFG